MKEDKQEICNKLTELLKLTRGGYDVQSIEYQEVRNNPDDKWPLYEFAVIHYLNGYSEKVNVTLDSGVAMIKDIFENVF